MRKMMMNLGIMRIIKVCNTVYFNLTFPLEHNGSDLNKYIHLLDIELICRFQLIY